MKLKFTSLDNSAIKQTEHIIQKTISVPQIHLTTIFQLFMLSQENVQMLYYFMMTRNLIVVPLL
jgi:hypothetical protein